MPASDRWTDTQLAAAVELNHIELLRLMGRLPWVEFHDDGDAIRIFAGDTWPPNQVAAARFAPHRAAQRVKELLAPHLEQKVACNWIVGPVSEPADLSRHLRAQGFHCMIHCSGMACRLKVLPRTPKPPGGVQIEEAHQPPQLLPLTTHRRKNHHRALCAINGFQPPCQWIFGASVEGKPAGQTVLVSGAGVAGIYGVEVLESYRRRGIGSALVHAALRQARALGFDFAVLSATGMGRSIYERLGFREVCKLSFWKYGKMRQL